MSTTRAATVYARQRQLDNAPALRTAPDGVHTEAIERSHERCTALGLRRSESPDYSPLGRGDLSEVRDRNQRLYTHAAPIMEMLCEQVVNTQSMVLLTDARGTVLHSIGDDDFMSRTSKIALQPGVDWSEQAKGTNAIGTALINETPTLVHASEHFMHANHFLSCSATPIFDPRGNMLGVLDITCDHRTYHQHTMGLVRMSARMIENNWLADDFRNVMRLHFHSRADYIGTLMEGILAVSREGRIMGANRSALDQLGMSGAAVRMMSVTSLFGTTVGGLVDHFRSPLALPMALTLPSGVQFYAQARFNWVHWYAVDAPAVDSPAPVPSSTEPGAGTSTLIGTARELPSRPFNASPETPQEAEARSARQALSGLRYLQTGDPQLETVIGKLKRVLDRDIPVLILGETGTGKELLARAIHQDSARSRQPFVAVNCASIPESLIEAELFGYEEGAFTGARRKGAPGRIVQANGGTLFLDEIGDMPLALQARLLRVLQERQVTPLGSSKSITVDVNLIGATHRNLREMIANSEFREDLYYRLNGLVVKLPALRERTDLLVIASKILRTEAPNRHLQIDPAVLRLFQAYPWPGNIRQLANVLRTAAVMAEQDPTIGREHLSDDFLEDAERQLPTGPTAGNEPGLGVQAQRQADTAGYPTPSASGPLYNSPGPPATPNNGRTLEQVELDMIRQAVDTAGGNISEASKRLGISRNTIYRKLRWNQPG
jgi:sigma-54 dependent transcriptional regulator, acetoin dehydrogenase operon transcriptional activator AcoR